MRKLLLILALALGVTACTVEGDVYNHDVDVLVLSGYDGIDIFELGEGEGLTDFGFNLVPIGNGSDSGKGLGSFKFNRPSGKKGFSTAKSEDIISDFPVLDYINPPATISITRVNTGQTRTFDWGTTVSLPRGESFTVTGWTDDQGNYSELMGYTVADYTFSVDNSGDDVTEELVATTTYSLFTVNDVTSAPVSGTLSDVVFTSSVNTESLVTATATNQDYYLFANEGQTVTLDINYSAIYTDSSGVSHTISINEQAVVDPTVAYNHYQYDFQLMIDETFNDNVNVNDPTDVSFTIVLDRSFNSVGVEIITATYTAVVQTFSEENAEGDFANIADDWYFDRLGGSNEYYINDSIGYENRTLISTGSGWAVRTITQGIEGPGHTYYAEDGSASGSIVYMASKDAAAYAAQLSI